MKHFLAGTMFAAVVGFSASGFAQGVPYDSFEYADTAALSAVWTDTGSSAPVTLESDGGHSGSKYLKAPTTNAQRTYAGGIDLTPSNASPVTVNFWFRTATTGSGRQYVTIGNAAATDVVQYGINNSLTGTQFMGRVNLGTPSGGTGFQNVGGTRVANQWANLKVEITTRDAKFYNDGTLGATISRTTSDFPRMQVFRIGSNLSSTVAADYDDLSVATGPAGVDDWNMY